MSRNRDVEELYRRYGGIVLRRARALLGEDDRARDAMHDVFVQILRDKAAFRGESSPATWLYRVTTNVCLNRIREHGRRSRREEQTAPLVESSPADCEDQLLVQQLLVHVPDEIAQVAVYYFVDRMQQDEIAGLLGVSERTVRSRLTEFKIVARTFLAPPQEVLS